MNKRDNNEQCPMSKLRIIIKSILYMDPGNEKSLNNAHRYYELNKSGIRVKLRMGSRQFLSFKTNSAT